MLMSAFTFMQPFRFELFYLGSMYNGLWSWLHPMQIWVSSIDVHADVIILSRSWHECPNGYQRWEKKNDELLSAKTFVDKIFAGTVHHWRNFDRQLRSGWRRLPAKAQRPPCQHRARVGAASNSLGLTNVKNSCNKSQQDCQILPKKAQKWFYETPPTSS